MFAFPLALVSGVPAWLLAGLFLGGLFGLLILGAFLAGERLFPAGRGRGSDGRRGRGERLRREEIRYYLQAIDESFEEDAAVEGREVAFHLPERDVAVTFDARSFLLLRDSGVHPVLVEHEMPGVHLGTRLPFETPDLGVGADPAPGDAADPTQAGFGGARDDRRDDHPGDARRRSDQGPDGDRQGERREALRTAYAVLGLPPSADAEAVRSAYRERVKEVHPDQGGDPEAFRRLQEAYATLDEHLAGPGAAPDPPA